MRTIMQAFTGGFDAPEDCVGMAERLASFAERAGADTAIIGWNPGAPYGEIIAMLHERNVRAFLWLPVFAEHGGSAVSALDYLGQVHEAAVSDADDDFAFACPRNEGNIGLAARRYDESFGSFPFDGVFLDKIRFSSFGNGFRSAMGCYCEDCCAFYRAEGVDIDAFRRLMRRGDRGFLIPAARHGMVYGFENELIDALFSARAKLMTASVRSVAEPFRRRGLAIGLDVYAPPLAYLCGQDIAALAEAADFIKPMIYRVTDAPAGLPYELSRMKSELAGNGCHIGSALEALWDTDELTSDACFAGQLAALEPVHCDICVGIEINKMGFCATSPAYVRGAIDAVRASNLAGCVLSWNVLAQTVYP